ncbi:MAG TPA: acyl-CoA synthetase, partial [Alphaproteobacteria bacterium]|nr:acyl-CoA synthetase [Alphaproteobacteria bacterium]
MDEYARIRSTFRWALPTHFNFGADVIDRLASADGGRLALLWCNEAGQERRFTFAEIAQATNRFANVLAAHGIARGDRVLIMLPRIPEWQIALVGSLKLGAVPVPAIEMLTAEDLGFRIRQSGARAVVCRAEACAKFKDLSAGLALRLSLGPAPGWLEYEAALARASESFAPPAIGLEEPAAIYYTSGTTGPPKGVTISARGLYCWRFAGQFWLDLAPGDLVWCTADTGWSKAATSVLLCPWSLGVAAFFYDGPFEPERRFKLIERYGVTVFCAAATELRRLIAAPGRLASSLRLVVSAGEAVDAELYEAWRA